MKLVLHYQGGFYGYYSPMVLIDTDKHIIAKNDDGPFGKTKEELFDITKYNHLKFFDENINLLECFLPTLEVQKGAGYEMDGFTYDIFLSTDKVPFRYIKLSEDGGEYIGNPALSAKLMKLIWTVCNKTYFKDADDIGSSLQ